MKRLVLAALCIVLAANVAMGKSEKPKASQYTPNIFWCADVESFHILRVETETWRDGRKSGIFLRELSGLPDYCWAIKYTYVWNGESSSPGYKRGRTDPEPIIVFISDEGGVVGVQSRLHGKWLPINCSLRSWDLVKPRHIMVAFAGNVHTPGAGFLHSLGLLAAGRAPGWIAKVLATGSIPNNDWVAAASKFLWELVRRGVAEDGGYKYALK